MTCCTETFLLRLSTQISHLLDISTWMFHGSKGTYFLPPLFPLVISPSSSSVLGNDIAASLLAQTRHLSIILRALFLPALLTQAGTSHLYSSYCYVHHPILLECCCRALSTVLLWHALLSPFPNLISCQCFLFRVIISTCKSKHVITSLKICQWLHQSE